MLVKGPDQVRSMVVANDLRLKRERFRKQFCQNGVLEDIDAHNLQNFVRAFL